MNEQPSPRSAHTGKVCHSSYKVNTFSNMDPFEPIELGKTEIKNRFAMAPMISNLADASGYTNDIHQAYLEERAIGGYGLVFTEYSYIDSPLSKGSRNEMSFVSYDQVPRLKRLTERIHAHGTKIFAQIVHAGGKALTEGNEKALAPSPVSYMGKVAQELNYEQMDQIKNAFLKAARICEVANFDGIELHGAHGYLLQEFISPALNVRNDVYGNDLKGRIKFPQEVIDLIRENTDFTVGMRLSLYEDDVDGYDATYGLSVAENLHGLDYIHLSSGRFAPPGSSASYYAPTNHIGKKLPRKPKVPTILVGSIVDMDSVKEALKKSDMVSMGRGSLADPHFPLKLKNNMIPRPCIRCNQGCRDLSLGQVRCTVNPITGNETHYGKERMQGKVTIAGAGVSGLEAAIYLAKAGGNVTLYEKESRIGGELNEYTEPEKKKEIEKLLNFYTYEISRLGIEVVLNSEKSKKDVDIYLPGMGKYRKLDSTSDRIIDSDIYRHLDEALQTSSTKQLTFTSRSLHSLDRDRQRGYGELAKQYGINFVEKVPETQVDSFYEKNQYDLYQACLRGINSARDFILLRNQ